jgi:hypothetical protein
MSSMIITSARLARRSPPAPQTAVAGLLAAGCVALAAIPVLPGGRGRALLVVASGLALLATVRLATAGLRGDPTVYHGTPARTGLALLAALQAIPWAEGLVLAVLGLEVMHHTQPYHTGLLGIALTAYLFATHLAESGARADMLRPQVPLLAAGLGLLALAVGASMLPAQAGAAASWLRLLAIIAAIVAGALALPA